MLEKIHNCGIEFFNSGVEVCWIEESNPDNIQFLKDHEKFDGIVSIHHQIGETDKGAVFFRCQTNIEGRHFHYEIRPQINWLRLLLKTGKINITYAGDYTILLSFTCDYELLRKDTRDIPQCKDWIEGEFE
jgi:hypothetical protein